MRVGIFDRHVWLEIAKIFPASTAVSATAFAETRRQVEREGRHCFLVAGDLSEPAFCHQAVRSTIDEFGRLDILVSNAAYQSWKHRLEEVDREEWEKTFKTNVTSSQVGLIGSEALPDYAATKGAINAFTKTLAQMLVERGIRVNAIQLRDWLDPARDRWAHDGRIKNPPVQTPGDFPNSSDR